MMTKMDGLGNRKIASREGTRTDVVAGKLRVLIVSGALKPGHRLSEREIAEQLEDVSRTPLREAFKVLAAEGLLTLEPNRGAVVTALSVQEVEASIEVLIGLETMAAEPACEHATDAQLAEIEQLHADMVEVHAKGDLMSYFQINQAIHQRIVDAACNPVLSRIYAAECARIRRYRYAGNQDPVRWRQAVREHGEMLVALKERAGPLLREMLRKHHKSGWAVSRTVLQQDPLNQGSGPVRKPRGRKPKSA
jgi:DNA-binding GntR family transcriptional regulator